MPTISPFTPQTNGTVNVTASTSSQYVQLPTGAGTQVRVLSSASVTVYLEFGASTVVASVGTSMPIFTATLVPEKITIPASGVVGSVATSGTQFAIAIASVATLGAIFVTRGEGF
jgi:hypothetical protein